MAFNPMHMLTRAYLMGAIESRPTSEAIRQGYIGPRLLPWKETPVRNFAWDVLYPENALAGIYDPRGEAIPGDDLLFSSLIAEVADVKAKRVLDSWTVQTLRDPATVSVFDATMASSPSARSTRARLRENFSKLMAWCQDRIMAQYEYLTMQALQGQIDWPPKDQSGSTISDPEPWWNAALSFSIVLPIPAAFKQNASTISGWNSRAGGGQNWKHASADPILDLEVLAELGKKTTGVTFRGGTILMSETVLSWMSTRANVLNWFTGSNKEQNDARQFVDQSELQSAIKTRTGWNIELYDAQWTYRTGSGGVKPTVNRVDFLKEGKIIIMPPGERMGDMMTAPLQTAPGPNADWQPGLNPWSYENPKPPYDIEVGVDATMFPRFDYYDWMVIDTFA